MKRLLLTGICFTLFAGLLVAAEPASKVYTTEQSAEHIGEVATVVGHVENVRILNSGTTLVNLDGRYPNQAFTIVVWPKNVKKVGDLSSFQGKRVRVTGKITEYHGKPEMIVTSRSQVAEASQ